MQVHAPPTPYCACASPAEMNVASPSARPVNSVLNILGSPPDECDRTLSRQRHRSTIGSRLPASLCNTAPKTIAGIVLAPEIAGVAGKSRASLVVLGQKL